MLLKLSGSVNFNDYIRPACLPQPESRISQHFIEIGWSDTEIRNNNLLHKLKMNEIPKAQCKLELINIGHYKHILSVENESTLCATVKKGERDMCAVRKIKFISNKETVVSATDLVNQNIKNEKFSSFFPLKGFAGAALLNAPRNTTGLDEIVGIASAQFGCVGGDPSIFTRVSAYIDWIESVVWHSEYKPETENNIHGGTVESGISRLWLNISLQIIGLTMCFVRIASNYL